MRERLQHRSRRCKKKNKLLITFSKLKNYSNSQKNLIILGSAHNQKEIQKKISQKCEAIFLSPVFNVKKSKKNLGLHKFNFLSYK